MMNLAHPLWLVALLLIPTIGIAALVVARRQQWIAFVAPRLRSVLLKRSGSLPRWLCFISLLAASGLLIVALARPQADAGVKVEKTLGRNLLIALDLSRSMRVSDVKPDRLAQAKVVIYELLEAMPNERVGLIGFAGSSYLYAPLTVDHSAVRETVEQVDETWAPLGGSDLAAAVQLAIETLKKTGQKNNALVILSDGEKHEGDLDGMITAAEKSGVYILAVGVGTENGGFVPNKDSPNGQMLDRDSRPIVSRLQPEVMRRLASETKGRFALAGSGTDIAEMVKSVVKDLDAFEMKGRERRVSVEFYQWLLLPALVLLVIAIVAGTFWRGLKAAALLGLLCFIPQPAQASDASVAKQALTEKRYETARELYRNLAEKSPQTELAARYRLGEAIASYRKGEYREARTAFSQALLSGAAETQAQAHLGLGNSLFQLGWQGLADEAYPTDSASLPDMNRFDSLVRERLAKLRESDVPEAGETLNYTRIDAMITNWADAIRHFDSASRSTPVHTAAAQNRELSLAYLRRLQLLLKQEDDDTKQAVPQPGEGEPQSGDGEADEGEPKDGKGGKGAKPKPDSKGKGDREKDGKQGDKPDPEKDGKGDKKGEPPQDEKDPNEGPTNRAKRILKENADTEKGPLTPGRREFNEPEQDW
jgi:Ca-activated chloride channel homolog